MPKAKSYTQSGTSSSRSSRLVNRRKRFKRNRGTIVQRLRQLSKRVKSINKGIETKHSEVSITSPTAFYLGSPHTIYPLPLVQSTSDLSARVGNKIIQTSLYMNFLIAGTFSTGGYSSLVRCMVIVIKDWNNASSLDLTKVLEDYSTSSGTPRSSIVSMYNWAHRKNYRVLYDEVIQFGLLNGNYYRQIEGNIRIPKDCQEVIYTNTAGAVTDVKQNQIIVALISEANNTNRVTTIEGACRLKYRDP